MNVRGKHSILKVNLQTEIIRSVADNIFPRPIGTGHSAELTCACTSSTWLRRDCIRDKCNTNDLLQRALEQNIELVRMPAAVELQLFINGNILDLHDAAFPAFHCSCLYPRDEKISANARRLWHHVCTEGCCLPPMVIRETRLS